MFWPNRTFSEQAAISLLLALCLLAAAAGPVEAQARIVNIDAKVSGCTNASKACDSAAEHLPPRTKVQLISPVNVRLAAGSYRISSAGSAGRYNGWRINSDNWWVWNFGIAIKQSGGYGSLFYVAFAGGDYVTVRHGLPSGMYTSQKGIASSKGPIFGGPGGPNAAVPRLAKSGGPNGYVDILTLSAPTTLSFFILDYYVPDNAGGVSLKIEPVHIDR